MNDIVTNFGTEEIFIGVINEESSYAPVFYNGSRNPVRVVDGGLQAMYTYKNE